MREVVLDTETTGLSPAEGHRVVEIGCLELVNHLPTGRKFHCHINPKIAMPAAAQEVHGHSDEFLADKPEFAAVADGFLVFIGDAPLIIHNAAFDLGFLNAELDRLKRAPIPASRAVDTVALARRTFPGSPASLDALCRRFEIDTSARTLHGALLDAGLLADVYLELIGGRQPGLSLAASAETGADTVVDNDTSASAPAAAAGTGPNQARPARRHAPSAEEQAAHADFITKLNEPIWKS